MASSPVIISVTAIILDVILYCFHGNKLQKLYAKKKPKFSNLKNKSKTNNKASWLEQDDDEDMEEE